MAASSHPSSPGMYGTGPDAVEQLAPVQQGASSSTQIEVPTGSALRTPTLPASPHHQHSRSQPFVSSADIYAAAQAAARKPVISSQSLAHSASSSLEFIAGQEELRALTNPYGFGASTPTSMSTNTKRASVTSFQTALSGSIANYLSADDSASGSARSSPAQRNKPLPSVSADYSSSANAYLSSRSADATHGERSRTAAYSPAVDAPALPQDDDTAHLGGIPASDTLTTIKNPVPSTHSGLTNMQTEESLQSAIPDFPPPVGVHPSAVNGLSSPPPPPKIIDGQGSVAALASAFERGNEANGTIRRPTAHRSQPSLASYANALTPKMEKSAQFDSIAAEQQLASATAGVGAPSAPVSDFRARPLANIDSPSGQPSRQPSVPVAAALLPKGQFNDSRDASGVDKVSDSPEGASREPSPPPDGEVEARAEWERAQILRSKMVSPTMGFSPNASGMTSRDRDSLRDSFRESLMNGAGSPSSTTSPRGSRGKLNLRPLHLVNAAAAGTSAVDAFNNTTSSGTNGSTTNSPPLSGVAPPAENGSAGRRSSGMWAGPGSPPFNGMRIAGNRSSANSSPALYYIDSTGNGVVANGSTTQADVNAYRSRQRASLQLQGPVLQSAAAMYAPPSASSSAAAAALAQLSRAAASPGAASSPQTPQVGGEGSSGAATPSLAGLSNPFGTGSAPTPTPGGASAHATAQQHVSLTPEQARALAAEQLASMPVTKEAAPSAEVAAASPAQGAAAGQQDELVEPPAVVPSQAPAGTRSRAATLDATQVRERPLREQPAVPGQGADPAAADATQPKAEGPSHASVTTQQLQRQQQRDQRRSASGVLALGPENGAAPGVNGGPYPVFPASSARMNAVASAQGGIPDKLAASSAALNAAIEQVQYLQQQAVAGVGTRPPAEIAAMAAQAQALANQQAVLTSISLGVPRESKSYPGVQPQPSLVPPFELQHRPDGLPSAMIGPDGVRRSLNDPEVCLECMMRDEDMIDVHVNAAAFWERESDAQFEEGCRMERDDEERRKSMVAAASIAEKPDLRPDSSLTDGTAAEGGPDGTMSREDGGSLMSGQSGSTKVESLIPTSGFGVTHVVGQTGISISPRDAMGMVRIGGSRMRVKRIAKGDPLTAERLKLHTQMNPPASSHRWRALQNFLATQAKYIAMEQRARYEAAAAAEREAVAAGQVPNVQYDNRIIRGATVADTKARQANGVYVEDVSLDAAEQEQKARDIASAQELRKRTSQRASVLSNPELAPRLNQQLPPVPPEAAAPVAKVDARRPSVPGLVEPPQIVGGSETPNMGGLQGSQFNTPSNQGLSPNAGSRLGASGGAFSNGDERLAHAALSPGSPAGPSTPGLGAHGQPLGSPMSINRSNYGFPDLAGAAGAEGVSGPTSIAKSEGGVEQRPSSSGADESLSKGRSKGLKKLFSKVANSGVDGESLRSNSLEQQASLDVDENQRSSQILGKGRESADALAPRFASIVSDGQKRSASALGFSSPSPQEELRAPEPERNAKPAAEVTLPPGGYYNDPTLAVSQTSLDIGPFQNPVPPPRFESKTAASQQKKTLPNAPANADATDEIVAELAARPGRPARGSQAGASPALNRDSSETTSPNFNAAGSPKANGNGSSTFGSRFSTQSLGSATLEAARKSVSSLRAGSAATSATTAQNQQFASTTPSMASLREIDDGNSRAQFGATPVPARSRNRSGSNSRNRESTDFLKPSEQRATPRKRSFFFRRSKVPTYEHDDDMAPRNMPARPMTSMGLHGEGSGLGRAREEKAASRFQRLLGGLFGTSSRKKRTSMASGRSGSDFDPFNRANAGSRASGFLKSGGLSLPRLLRPRTSNSNMDKPLSLEKGISNHDPLPNLRGFSGARDERGLPLRAQSAMGRLPSQKFTTSGPSFGAPTWASPRSFDEDDEPTDAEMRPDPLGSKRKGLGGSRNKLGAPTGDLLKSPTQFGGSSSSIATSFTQYGGAGAGAGGPPPRLPMRQSSRGSNMKASINLSLPGVHEV
ncbi:hypothetical protein OC835_001843 [Tilletia horrida]|nr:hypothetical protein OC835_001843 [Tilletia horrida]